MPLFEVSKEIISEIDPKRLVKLIVDDCSERNRVLIKRVLCLMDEETGKIQYEGRLWHVTCIFAETLKKDTAKK